MAAAAVDSSENHSAQPMGRMCSEEGHLERAWSVKGSPAAAPQAAAEPVSMPKSDWEEPAQQGQRRPCNCRKSRCLKLYCECFAAGAFCDDCACERCGNTPANAHAVRAVRSDILRRAPHAFAHPAAAAGERGCHCRKSRCLKKYCQCFQANLRCTDACRCDDCQNVEDANETGGPPAPTAVASRAALGPERADAAEAGAGSPSRKATHARLHGVGPDNLYAARMERGGSTGQVPAEHGGVGQAAPAMVRPRSASTLRGSSLVAAEGASKAQHQGTRAQRAAALAACAGVCKPSASFQGSPLPSARLRGDSDTADDATSPAPRCGQEAAPRRRKRISAGGAAGPAATAPSPKRHALGATLPGQGAASWGTAPATSEVLRNAHSWGGRQLLARSCSVPASNGAGPTASGGAGAEPADPGQEPHEGRPQEALAEEALRSPAAGRLQPRPHQDAQRLAGPVRAIFGRPCKPLDGVNLPPARRTAGKTGRRGGAGRLKPQDGTAARAGKENAACELDVTADAVQALLSLF